MEKLAVALSSYDELAARVDPEEEPYKSKYEGRAILEAFLAAHSDAHTDDAWSLSGLKRADAVAIVSGRLGVNLLQCEETTPAEKPLQCCLVQSVERTAFLDSFSGARLEHSLSPHDAARLIHAGMEAANHLALLYSGWDMHSKALAALEQGRTLYGRARRMLSGCSVSIAVGNGSAASVVGASQVAALDALFTHTTFYLAQVHGHLGHSVDTHRYIEATLSRQLDEQRAASVAAIAAATAVVAPAVAAATAAPTAADSSATGGAKGTLQEEAAVTAATTAARGSGDAASAAVPAPSAAAPPAAHSASGADSGALASAPSPAPAPAAAESAGGAASAAAAPAAPVSAPLFAVDRHEWVRNALRLSGLYCGRVQWVAAAHCLAAADVVLQQAIAAASAAAPASSSSAAGGAGAGTAAAVAAASSSDACSAAAMEAAHVPDGLQRLYAEVATHWARLYVDILGTARECSQARADSASDRGSSSSGSSAAVDNSEWERGWDRQWATKSEPTAASGGAGAGAASTDGETADPFSTMPAPPKFPSAAAGAAESSSDSSGSAADSDEVLLTALPPEPAGAGKSAVPGRAGGPFAVFLIREAPAVRPGAYTSYGPLHIAAAPAAGAAAGSSAVTAAAAGGSSGSSTSALTEPAAPPCAGLCLSGLRRAPMPSAVAAGGFDAARDVFRAANSACQRALQYLRLDGFVSDHVEVLQLLCRAYKYLSHWETDAKRAASMHLRRAELVEPVLREASPAVYIHMHKQLALEAASALQEAYEKRLARAESEATPAKRAAALGSAQECLDKAVVHYAHFLRCYSDPRLAKGGGGPVPIDAANRPLEPLQGATALDDGSVDAFFTAHFALARLLSKRIMPSTPVQLEVLKAALRRFEWVVRLADSNAVRPPTGYSESMRAHVDMSREMTRLLPEKLALLATRGTLVDGSASRIISGSTGGK